MSGFIDKTCSKIIEYSFYFLFFLVPLIYTNNTSELFEFNKMWITFGITSIITASWLIQMILRKKIFFQKTPLDLPILLFLASQIVSTLFSWDKHISVWGYYSRFNGGLLSTISYILLYYAFVTFWSYTKEKEEKSHSSKRVKIFLFLTGLVLIPLGILFSAPPTSDPAGGNPAIFFVFICISIFLFIASFPAGFINRILSSSLTTGAIVALWGFPSHFGLDPTCLLFRGSLDVSCWTESFQPKIRIFSTLGQPNWLAAYLSVLVPLSLGLAFTNLKNNSEQEEKYHVLGIKYYVLNKKFILTTLYFILATLFYIDILFTRARSGILGLGIGLIFFFVGFLLFERNRKSYPVTALFIVVFAVVTFFFGSSISQIEKFTYPKIIETLSISKNQSQSNQDKNTIQQEPQGPALETGGTESGAIRVNVWKGAIEAWRNNFLFGTGVETFAFAYYRYAPRQHNLTSEWDFLYNKAHNEYLNYLATTGTFGFLTYIAMIGMFLWFAIRSIIQSKNKWKITIIALVAGYISILVSNFFGFSVVIVNIYLFLIPALVFILTSSILPEKNIVISKSVGTGQWVGISGITFIVFYVLFVLYRFWQADVAYALGYNYSRINALDRAYPLLHKAVQIRGNEPVFKDELTISNAALAVEFVKQKDATSASSLAQEAIATSDILYKEYPNNIVFLKTRVRMFSTLAQLNPQYITYALETLVKAAELAPTDAKIMYNLGIIYGQSGQTEKALEFFQKTISLRPVYVDAYYALGLFYHDIGVDEKGKVTNQDYFNKGVEQMRYIIKNFPASKKSAEDALKTWKVE